MIGDILQPTHLIFVLVVALLVLGPKRLPEMARSLGNGMRDFKSAINGEAHDGGSFLGSDHPAGETPPPATSADHAPTFEPGPAAPTATYEPDPRAPTATYEPDSAAPTDVYEATPVDDDSTSTGHQPTSSDHTHEREPRSLMDSESAYEDTPVERTPKYEPTPGHVPDHTDTYAYGSDSTDAPEPHDSAPAEPTPTAPDPANAAPEHPAPASPAAGEPTEGHTPASPAAGEPTEGHTPASPAAGEPTEGHTPASPAAGEPTGVHTPAGSEPDSA